MGFFTAAEWLRGLAPLQADSADKLRARLDQLRALLDRPDHFKAIYRFAFDFARVSTFTAPAAVPTDVASRQEVADPGCQYYVETRDGTESWK